MEPPPAVWRRSAVGIFTVIAMLSSAAEAAHVFNSCGAARGRALFRTNSKQIRALCAHRGCIFFRNLGNVQRLLQIIFEFRELGRDRLFCLVDTCQGVGRLQAIAGDAPYAGFLGEHSVLAIKLPPSPPPHAAATSA